VAVGVAAVGVMVGSTMGAEVGAEVGVDVGEAVALGGPEYSGSRGW